MRTIVAFCAIILACGILGCGESGPPADNSNVKTPAPPPPPGGAPGSQPLLRNLWYPGFGMKRVFCTVVFVFSIVLSFLSGLAWIVVIASDLTSPYTKFYFLITTVLLIAGILGSITTNRQLKQLTLSEDQPSLPF